MGTTSPSEFLAADSAGSLNDKQAALLREPPFRTKLYRLLGLGERFREHHGLLLSLFQEELEYRLAHDAEDHCEAFENIYQCALYLFEIGDLNDVRLLSRARFSGDMDLGSGFDVEFLVGAGVDETLCFLRQQDEPWAMEAALWVDACHRDGHFDGLNEWLNWRWEYFGLSRNPVE